MNMRSPAKGSRDAIGHFRYWTKLDGELFSRAGRWTVTFFESWTVRSDGGYQVVAQLDGGRWTVTS